MNIVLAKIIIIIIAQDNVPVNTVVKQSYHAQNKHISNLSKPKSIIKQ